MRRPCKENVGDGTQRAQEKVLNACVVETSVPMSFKQIQMKKYGRSQQTHIVFSVEVHNVSILERKRADNPHKRK